jgi:hypothetical protein
MEAENITAKKQSTVSSITPDGALFEASMRQIQISVRFFASQFRCLLAISLVKISNMLPLDIAAA